MNIIFDGAKLARLTADVHALCGVRLRVLRADGEELCALPDPLCARLCGAGGKGRCLPVRFDASPFFRCRAGALCAALPLCADAPRAPLAWLVAGPLADDLDAEALRGLTGVMEMLADYIRLKGLVRPAAESDLQRLERFLDEHYTEKLSLAAISAQLHIGRTRLCALAKELSGGETLFSMIAWRRIEAAKAMLANSDRSISAVAEAVGISDYNYFSKIFRAATGSSPSEFRKRARRDLDDLV